MTIRIGRVRRFLSQINNAKENMERAGGKKKKVGKPTPTDQQK